MSEIHNRETFKGEIQIKTLIHEGMAVYQVGQGEPLLLFPYPHGSTFTSISESLICNLLVEMGRTVITFDPPEAYKSTRKGDFSLKEMLECGEEALGCFGITEPIDVVGHSMGGFCALAFTVMKRKRVKKLLVICGNPGYSEVSSQWFGSKFITGLDFTKLTWYGFKEIIGMGSLKNHKKMNNLLDYHLFVDKAFFQPRIIYKGDWRRPAPARNKWMNAIRKEGYSEYLEEINIPVLLMSGRNDILSSEKVNENMHEKLKNSKLVYFQKSRHFPFIEEREKFVEYAGNFLNG